LGTANVQAFCRSDDSSVSSALRALGLPVTEVDAEGLDGPVHVVSTVVPRRTVPLVVGAIEENDPDAFIAVYDARVHRSPLTTLRRK